VLLLATYAVIRYTNSENLTTVLAELLGFVLALMGIASYQNILKDKNK